MFLYSATLDELNGQNDIGNVVAIKLFGPRLGAGFSMLFSFALLSTLSAMTIAGPGSRKRWARITRFSFRCQKERFDMPYIAILVQAGWSVFLVLVSSLKRSFNTSPSVSPFLRC